MLNVNGIRVTNEQNSSFIATVAEKARKTTLNNKIMSEKKLKKSQQCLESSYWKRRFKQFSLDYLMSSFPSDREGVFESLKTITGYLPDATIAPSIIQNRV